MIKLKELLLEALSYAGLLQLSKNKKNNSRMDRAKDVQARSLRVMAMPDGNDAWIFSYKSYPKEKSTTGKRHRGHIIFKNPRGLTAAEISKSANLKCDVDCSCPDYTFRWAHNNHTNDASPIGNDSLNKCIDREPIINLGSGLCKHLIALKNFFNFVVKTPKKQTAVAPTDISEPTKKSTKQTDIAPDSTIEKNKKTTKKITSKSSIAPSDKKAMKPALSKKTDVAPMQEPEEEPIEKPSGKLTKKSTNKTSLSRKKTNIAPDEEMLNEDVQDVMETLMDQYDQIGKIAEKYKVFDL